VAGSLRRRVGGGLGRGCVGWGRAAAVGGAAVSRRGAPPSAAVLLQQTQPGLRPPTILLRSQPGTLEQQPPHGTAAATQEGAGCTEKVPRRGQPQGGSRAAWIPETIVNHPDAPHPCPQWRVVGGEEHASTVLQGKALSQVVAPGRERMPAPVRVAEFQAFPLPSSHLGQKRGAWIPDELACTNRPTGRIDSRHPELKRPADGCFGLQAQAPFPLLTAQRQGTGWPAS